MGSATSEHAANTGSAAVSPPFKSNKTAGNLIVVELEPIVVTATVADDPGLGENIDAAVSEANKFLDAFKERGAALAKQVNDFYGGAPGEALGYVAEKLSNFDLPYVSEAIHGGIEKVVDASGGNRFVLAAAALGTALGEVAAPQNAVDFIAPGASKFARVAGKAARAARLERPLAREVERAAAMPPSGDLSSAAAAQAALERPKGLGKEPAGDAPPPPPKDPGVAVSKADIWTKVRARLRGRIIEDDLAKTEYRDWIHTDELPGFSRSRNYPVIDFARENEVVSLKTADTRLTSWPKNLRADIRKLSRADIRKLPKIQGLVSGEARKILDLRVQPGGIGVGGQRLQDLIGYARAHGVELRIKQYP